MAKTRSFGAEVYINGIAVGGLTDISASGTDVAFIESTSHDTAGGFRTFLSGLKDGGTLELTGKYNYSNAGQAEWKAEEGVSHTFYIILADNSGFAFTAIVGGFQTSNPLDDAVEFTATARITGEVLPVFPTITVTGTLTSNGSTPVTFVNLLFAGISDGRPAYTDEAKTLGSAIEAVYYNGTSWVLTAANGTVTWLDAEDVLTPDTVTWTGSAQSPATGTPTLTGS